MLRSSAETAFTESDCSSPNRLPIAAAAHPPGVPRTAELERRQVESLRVDLQEREVGVQVTPHDLRGHAIAVELHEHALRLLRVVVLLRHDVRIRGDVALVVEQEPRALAALATVEHARRAVEQRDDRDDPGRGNCE